MKLYRTIVADPPWQYDSAANARARPKYRTMTMGELVDLPVQELADDHAHLWLWVTNAMMEKGHRLARYWGFAPFTIVTWCKPGPGLGHYVRTNTEHVLLCSRGRPTVPETKAMSSWFQWPRTRHSEKPETFFDLVQQISPPPYLELFSRHARMGWDHWGDEAIDSIEMPRAA
jgi:N6-adenosine-specific RNA methylase IME4